MLQVGYHGSSATQTLVCDGTLASGFRGPFEDLALGCVWVQC